MHGGRVDGPLRARYTSEPLRHGRAHSYGGRCSITCPGRPLQASKARLPRCARGQRAAAAAGPAQQLRAGRCCCWAGRVL
jgi:hypothetical protein